MTEQEVRTRFTSTGARVVGAAFRKVGDAAKWTAAAAKEGAEKWREFEKSVEGTHKNLKKLSSQFKQARGAVGGFLTTAKEIVTTFHSMALEGEKARNVAGAFKELGGTERDMVKLRDATNNMVDDTTLQRVANMSKLYGVAQKDFEKLIDVAKGSSAALGGDLTKSVEGVMLAFSKRSVDRADEFGVKMDSLGVIYKRAMRELNVDKIEDLTEAQKDAAFQAEFFNKAQKQMALGSKEVASSAAQAQTAWENFKSELEVGVSEVFDNTIRKMKEMDQRAKNLAKSLVGPGYGDKEAQDVLKRNAEFTVEREKRIRAELKKTQRGFRMSIEAAKEDQAELKRLQEQMYNAAVSIENIKLKPWRGDLKAAEEQFKSAEAALETFAQSAENKAYRINQFKGEFRDAITGFVKDGQEAIKEQEKAEREQEAERKRRYEERKRRREREIADHAKFVESLVGHWMDHNRQLTQLMQANRLMFGQHFKAIADKNQELVDELKRRQMGEGIAGIADASTSNRLDAAMANSRQVLGGIGAIKAEMLTQVDEAQAKINEADQQRINALVSGGMQAAKVAQDFAGAFAKTEKQRALISMFMETAASIGAFASGNILGGTLHAAAAVKYGVVAGRSAGSSKEKAKKAQKAQNMPRGDMNFGWSSMGRRKNASATTQTIVQQFQFGSPGPAGRALADTLNAAVRGSTGVALDQRITRKVGRPGY